MKRSRINSQPIFIKPIKRIVKNNLKKKLKEDLLAKNKNKKKVATKKNVSKK